jgi:hypothetical protein
MNRDIASGTLLILGSMVGVLVMALHPTGHGVMSSGPGGHLAQVNVLVHSLALVATPMTFFGLLGLWRRLGQPLMGTAALVAFGWGCVAVMSAAAASGFVATGVMARMSDPGAPTMSADFVTYTALWNRAFAKVYVVASCVAIILFAVAILRNGRFSLAAGVAGVIVAPLILVLFFVGHLTVDLHGFGAITFAESAWLAWVGVLLLRDADGRAG